MATELAKAYVQVIPTTTGIKRNLTKELGGDVSSAGESAGESFGSSLVSKLKGVIVAAGIGSVIKSALDAGGALQQSFGGLDTIYGEASEAAKQYAQEASKVGISANEYAEQAVSFGASLKQAFGGDTTKAVEAANTAIMDMTDNAAKMGTPIENIQNAYQGFAKQNYTMLDNLKLGYGGTKTEMQRLLEDATKLSGVEYDLNNLGDVYDAIHVIQEDLGLTGVAAAEASETFTGSMGSMKASATNLLAALTTGGDVEGAFSELSNNIFSFVFNNALPMISQLVEAIPDVVEGALSMMVRVLNKSEDGPGAIVKTVVEVLGKVATSLVEFAPYLVESSIHLVKALIEAIAEFDWIGFARTTIEAFKDGLDFAAGEILGQDEFIVSDLIEGMLTKIEEFRLVAFEIVQNIIYGIMEKLPNIISTAGELMSNFLASLMEKLPSIMESGWEMVKTLTNGISQRLPDIAKSALEVLAKLIATIGQNLPQILGTGLKIIMELITGMLKAIPKIIESVPKIIEAIKDAFSKFDWKEIGADIIAGIKKGFTDAIGNLVDAAREAGESVLGAAKKALKIGSPSKVMADEVGQWIPAGIAQGIENNSGIITDAIEDATRSSVRSTVDFTKAQAQNYQSGIYTPNTSDDGLIALLERYLPIIAEGKEIILQPNNDALFDIVRTESNKFKKITGTSAFA